MKPYKIDISVLVIFFTRHEIFRKVFDEVKKARPARLFLYQDGPREGRPDDLVNIQKCREIAEDIDWECEVHKFYQERNVGVDPSGYIADTWAFSLTDKCIVLEDDIIPSQSLFAFHKAMLDRYENDERVMLVSGMNLKEISKEIEDDYFFSRTTITLAWASWARVVRQWDASYSFLDDKVKIENFNRFIKKHKLVRNFEQVCRAHRATQKAHFETILISNQYLHEGFTIVPKKNMALHIGIDPDSAHYTTELRFLPKGLRKVNSMPIYEIDTENIHHPNSIKDHVKYKKQVYWIHGWNHPVLKTLRFIGTCSKKIIHGRFSEVIQDCKKRLKK